MKTDIMKHIYIYNVWKQQTGTSRMSLLGAALFILHASLFVSCTALDEAPDNRTEITSSPDKIQQLLTSGYPLSTPAIICELAGDNMVDDNVVVPSTHSDPYYKFHEEAYYWQNIVEYSTGEDDTPYQVWESYYAGIAVCNHAIQAMEEMSDDPASNPELSHSWGEAHILRAYLHFILVNVFAEAYKNDSQSSQDRGIPYVTRPETTVKVNYSSSEYLHDVKTTYDLIEKDILEGIDLIQDAKYKVPAYHFNKKAANAFAARFYLFKRDYQKCLKYANDALGANPQLRNWRNLKKNTLTATVNEYNDEKLSCNYLIQSTYSLQWRMLVSSTRFAINTGTNFKDGNGKTWHVPSSLDATIWGSGPNWSGTLPAFSGMVYINSAGQQYGAWLFRLYEYFEYTDKIAGIGYVHQIYQPLSADETLLCRAEAKLYLGDRDGAIRDLDLWTSSHLVTTTLTLDAIKRKYSRTSANNDFVNNLYEVVPNTKDTIWYSQMMGFEKVLKGDDLSVLDCILHFRRIETIHEGQRWYDIKRYGMKVYHFYRGPLEDEIHVDSLTWNDPRRVFEIPDNVIQAGYSSNRETGSYGTSSGEGFKMPASTDIQPQLYK